VEEIAINRHKKLNIKVKKINNFKNKNKSKVLLLSKRNNKNY
jgi:2'-5' RNA ligase